MVSLSLSWASMSLSLRRFFFRGPAPLFFYLRWSLHFLTATRCTLNFSQWTPSNCWTLQYCTAYSEFCSIWYQTAWQALNKNFGISSPFILCKAMRCTQMLWRPIHFVVFSLKYVSGFSVCKIVQRLSNSGYRGCWSNRCQCYLHCRNQKERPKRPRKKEHDIQRFS